MPPIKGIIEPANIELYNRKVLKNPDGSVSTTSSMSFEENGQEILIPTVINGRRYSSEDAVAHYRRTNEHLGKFKNPEAANSFAKKLHEEQEERAAWQTFFELLD